MMESRIRGLHHVTATVTDAQEDVDFYTALLGLRLVKKTVNFDNTGVYHLYYGNEKGTPGTIMTTFPYGGKGVRVGRKGTGQIITTSFSVPPDSISFWKDRLGEFSPDVREARNRFEEEVIEFDDPSGLVLELVAADRDSRTGRATDEIQANHAVRGVHSVTLAVRNPTGTRELLEDLLGFRLLGRENNRVRFGIGEEEAGQLLDVLHVPEGPDGINGLGTVHHVALAVDSDQDQLELRNKLIASGCQVTEVRDRQYFRSIYFREPGGILLEIATAGPGFLIDEDIDSLGRQLKLAPWDEPERAAIEASLESLKTEP